jgi:hypothetical protein
MKISSTVNTVATVSGSFAAAPGGQLPSRAQTETAVPSFITPASLASVSGGTAAVTLLSQVAKTLFGKAAATPWIPFFCALAVGAAIYFISVEDKNVHLSVGERAAGVFIALLNSMVLFSATLGILGR